MHRVAVGTVARLAALICLGLGAAAAWSQAVSTPYSYSRTSSFTYNANGVLASEKVEPDLAQQCVETTYTYDAYGNKAGASTANCSGAAGLALFDIRASSAAYAAQTVSVGSSSVTIPAGTFATSTRVALTANIADAASHTEARQYDPRFGVVSKLTGPNALDTTWQFDAFGRKILEIRTDGTRTAVLYCLIAGRFNPAGNTSSNSSGCPSPASTEIPALAVRFEHSEPRNSSNAKIGAFTRVYYDRAGRKLRTATEAFDGPDQPAGAGSLIVQDSHYDAHGAVTVATAAYFLANKSSTTGGNNDMGLTRTVYDALGRAKEIYTADPATTQQTGGSVASVAFGSYGSQRAARTSVAYNGLVTTTTDDQGRTRVEEKNPLGLLVRVTDATGAQIVHQHDAFGNLVRTKDPLGNLITVKYDVRGRKVRLEDPDAGASDYCHDALGQLKAQRNAKMRGSHATSACPPASGAGTVAPSVTGWTTLAYDRIGRMTSRIEPEYTSSWHYDRYADASACNKGIGKLCQSSTSHGVSRRLVYDSLGRPSSTRTDIGGGPSMASHIGYGSSGSATGKPVSQTWPTGVRVSYAYTARGYLLDVKNDTALTGSAPLAAGAALWRAGIVNARGQPERQTYANNVHNRAVYEPRSGRLTHLTAGTGSSNGVVHQRLHWDSVDRLTMRVDGVGDGSSGIEILDSYTYDALGRMTKHVVSGNGTPNVRTVELQYNALGLLLYKSDVGVYTYPAQGTSHGRPHAVQSISGAHGASYGYDLNGNAISASAGKWRSVSYTSFNLPDAGNGLQGPGGTPKYVWQYDENHQRIRETRTNGQGTRTTWSHHPDNQGGLGFEREVPPSGSAQNRHYIGAAGQVIGVIVTEGNLPTLASGQTAPAFASTIAAVKLQFWHKDHLGSTIATTSHTGAVTARYSYDPFGKRRNVNGTYDPFGNIVIDWAAGTAAGTDRGYTGHEHLDDAGIVHMNGRIFDPVIARFLQADPFIQAPGNLQNYDRYAYCFNSPSTCTDPNGYFFKWIAKKWREEIWRTPIGRAAVSIAVAYYTGQMYQGYAAGTTLAGGTAATIPGLGIAGTSAVIGGFAGGAMASGTLRGGLEGALTGAAFYGVGSSFAAGSAGSYAGHAAVGCVSAQMKGGKCGQGAAAQLVSKYTTVEWHANVITAAVVGGSVSAIGGGSFANGAATGAFGYLFNQLTRAQELMNERIKSGAACPPSHAHMCAGLRAGTPEEVVKAAAMEKAAGLVADKVSTGLAMAAVVPNPLSPELAGAALVLKGFATYANPPTRAEIFYDSVTTFAPATRFPYFDALIIYSLDLAKPVLTQPRSCPIPQKC